MGPRNIITLTGELSLGQMSARLKALKSAIEPTRNELTRLKTEIDTINAIAEKDRTKEQVATLKKLQTEYKNTELVLKDLEAETTNNARAMSALAKVQLKGFAASTGNELKRAIKEAEAKLRNFTGKQMSMEVSILGVDGVRQKVTVLREDLEKFIRVANTELKVRMGGMGDALKESQAMRAELEKLTPIQREQRAAEQAKHQETLRAYNEERNVYIENVEMYRQQEKELFEEKKGYESTIADLRAKGVTKVTTYKESDVTKQEETILAKVRLREAAERKVAEAKQKATDAGIIEQMMENGVVSAAEKQAQVQQTIAPVVQQVATATEHQAQAQQQVNEQLQKTIELTKEQKAAMKQQANDTIKQVHGAAMSTTDYVGDKTKFFQYQQKMAGADVWERLDKMQRTGTKFSDPLGFSYNPFSVSELEKEIELLKQMNTEEKKVAQDAPKAGASPLQGLHQFVAGLNAEFKEIVTSAQKAKVDINDFQIGKIGEAAQDLAANISRTMKDGKVLSEPLMQQANETFAKLKQMLADWKASVANKQNVNIGGMKDLIGWSNADGLRGIISKATPGTSAVPVAAPVVQKPAELPYYMTADYEMFYRRQLNIELSKKNGISLGMDPDKTPAAIKKDVEAAMEQSRQMRDNPEMRQKFIEVYQNAITTMKADMDAIRGAADQAMQEAQKLGANSPAQYKEKLTRSVAPLKGKLGIREANGGKLPWDDPEQEKKVVQALNMRNRAEGLATISMDQATNAGKQEAQQIAALTQQNEQEAKSTMTRAEALAKLQEAWMKLNGSRQHMITSDESIMTESGEKVRKSTSRNVSAQEFFEYRYGGKGVSHGESALAEDSKSLNQKIATAKAQLPILDALASAPVRNAVKADGELLMRDFNSKIVNGLKEVSSNKKLQTAAQQIGENIRKVVSSEMFKRGGAESQVIFEQITQWITQVRQQIDRVAGDTSMTKSQKVENGLLPLMNASKPAIQDIADKYANTGLTEEQMKRPAEAAAKLREELAKNEEMLKLVEQAQRSWNNTTAQTTQATEQEATAVATNAQATQQQTQATQQQVQATEKQIQAQQHANQQNQLTREIAQGVIADMVNQGQIEHQLADDKRVVTNITQEEVNAKKQLIATAEGELEAAKQAEQAERNKLNTIQASIGNAEKLVEAEENQVAAEKDLKEATKNREEEERKLHEFEEQRKADVQAAEQYMKKYGQSLVMSEGDIKRYISALQAARTENGVTPSQYKEYGKDISFWKEMLGELTKNINTSMKNLGDVSDPVLKTLKQHFTDIVNDVDASDAAVKRATKSLEKINKEEHRRSIKSITSIGIDGLDVGAIQKRIQEAQQLQKNALTAKKEWKDLQTVIDAGTKSLEKFYAEQAKSQSRKDLRMLSGSKIGTLSEQEISDAVKRLQQYAQQANLATEEREKLNKAIERGNLILQKTANGDNLSRMEAQYNYLAKSRKNLDQMSDDALAKQSKYWLQMASQVGITADQEKMYIERFNKTTQALDKRIEKQQDLQRTMENQRIQAVEDKAIKSGMLDMENKYYQVVKKRLIEEAANAPLSKEKATLLKNMLDTEFKIAEKVKSESESRQKAANEQRITDTMNKALAEGRLAADDKDYQVIKNRLSLILTESGEHQKEETLLKNMLKTEFDRNEVIKKQTESLAKAANEQRITETMNKALAEGRLATDDKDYQVIKNRLSLILTESGEHQKEEALLKNMLKTEFERNEIIKKETESLAKAANEQRITETMNKALAEGRLAADDKDYQVIKNRLVAIAAEGDLNEHQTTLLNNMIDAEAKRNQYIKERNTEQQRQQQLLQLAKVTQNDIMSLSGVNMQSIKSPDLKNIRQQVMDSYTRKQDLAFTGTDGKQITLNLEQQRKVIETIIEEERARLALEKELTAETKVKADADAIRAKVMNTDAIRLEKKQELEREEQKLSTLENQTANKRTETANKIAALDEERKNRSQSMVSFQEKENRLLEDKKALEDQVTAAEKIRADVLAKYAGTGLAITPEVLAKENQIYAENGAKIREILAQREQSQKRVQELTAQQTLLDKDEEQTLLRIERLNEQIANTKNKAERGRLVAQRDNLQNELPALSARRQLIDEEIQKQQQLDREYQKSHETLRNINGYLREYKNAQEGVRAAAEAVANKEREIQQLRMRKPMEMSQAEYDNRVKGAERELELAKQNEQVQRTLVEQKKAALDAGIGIELTEEQIRTNLLNLQREEFELLKKAETERLLSMDKATEEEAVYKAQENLVRNIFTIEQERAATQSRITKDIQHNLQVEEAQKLMEGDITKLTSEQLQLVKKVYQEKAQLNGMDSADAEQLVRVLRLEQERANINKELQQRATVQPMKLDEAKSILTNSISQPFEKVNDALKVSKEYLQTMPRDTDANRKAALELSASIEKCEQEQKKFNEESKLMVMSEQFSKLNTMSMSALDAQEKFWAEQVKGAERGSEALSGYTTKLGVVRSQMAANSAQQLGISYYRQSMDNSTGVASLSGLTANGTGVISQIQNGTLGSIEAMKQAQKEVELFKEKFADPKDANGMKMLSNAIEQVKLQIEAAERGLLPMDQALEQVVQDGKLLTAESDAMKSFVKDSTIADLERLRDSLKNASEQYKLLGNEESAKKAANGMAELEKAALAAGKTLQTTASGLKKEQEAAFKISKEMQSIADNPKATMSIKKLKQAYSELKRQIDEADNSQKEYNKNAAKLRAIDQQLQRIQGNVHATKSLATQVFEGIKSYAMMHFGIQMLTFKLAGLIGGNKQLSDSEANVAKVTGIATEEMHKLTGAIQNIDTRTGTEQLMKMAEQAGKLGIYTREGARGLEEFVKVADKITMTLGEDIGGPEAVGDLVKLNDLIGGQQGSLGENLEKLGSAILSVGNNSSASYEGVVSFLRQTGAVGSVAGLNAKQLTALGATYSSLGAKMDQTATSINKFLIGLQRNYFSVAQTLGMSAVELKKMIDDGQTFEALQAVIDRVHELGSAGENTADNIGKLLKAMGGRQNAQMFTAMSLLVNNASRLREELGYASDAYDKGTLMADEYARMQNTLAGQMAKTGKAIHDAFVNPAVQEGLVKIASAFGWIARQLIGLPGLVMLTVYSAMKLIVALKEIRSIKWIQNLTNGFATFGSSMSVVWTDLKASLKWYRSEMNSATAMTGKLAAGFGMVRSVGVAALGALKAALASTGIMALVMGITWLVTKFIEARNAVDATTKAAIIFDEEIGEGAKAIRKLNKETEELEKAKEKVETLAESYAKLKTQTGKDINELVRMKDKFEDLGDAGEEQIKVNKELTESQQDYEQKLRDFNKQYSSYLGFEIQDFNNASLVASAHDKVAIALEREALARAKNRAEESIMENYKESLGGDANDLMTDLKNMRSKGWFKKDVDITDIYSDLMLAVQKSAEEQVKSGKSNFNASDAQNAVNAALQQYMSSPKKKYTDYTDWGFGVNKRNVNQYGSTYFEQTRDLAANDKLVQKKADVIDARNRYTQGNLDKKRLSEIELYLTDQVRLERMNDANRETFLKQASEFLGSLKAQSLEAVKNGGLQPLGMTGDGIDNLLSKLDDAKAKNRTILRESVWGRGGSTLASMGASEVKEVNEILNNVDKAVQEGTDINELANMLAGDDSTNGPLVRMRDNLRMLTEDAQKAGKSELEIAEMQRKFLDQQHEALSERAKQLHITLEGNFSHPDENGGKDKWKQEAKDQYNAYIKELDDYYVRRQMVIEEQRAKGLLIEEEYNKRTETLERQHLANRAKLRNMYMKGVLYDSNVGELDAQIRQAIYGKSRKSSETWEQWQTRWTEEFNKNKELINKLGDAFVDEIKLKSDEDRIKILQTLRKAQDELEKAIIEGRPYEKLGRDMMKNLDDAHLLFGMKDFALGKEHATEEYGKRIDQVFAIVRNAYKNGASSIKQAVEDAKIEEAWGLDKQEIELLISRIEEFAGQYEEVVRKEANRMKKIMEQEYKLGGDDSWDMYKERVNTLTDKIRDRFARWESAGFGGNYLGLQSSDTQSYRSAQQKLAIAQAEMLDIESRRAKELKDAVAQGKKEADMQQIREKWEILEVEKKKELIGLNQEIAKQQEEMAMKVYSFMKQYADLASETLSQVVNAGATLRSDNALQDAKTAFNKSRGIGLERSEYVIYSSDKDNPYQTKWLNEEERIEMERKIALKNAQVDAATEYLNKWGEKMAQDITDAMQRRLNDQSVMTAEEEAEQQRLHLTQERVNLQKAAEEDFTRTFQRELQSRIEAMATFAETMEQLNRKAYGGGQLTASDAMNVAQAASGVQNAVDEAGKASSEFYPGISQFANSEQPASPFVNWMGDNAPEVTMANWGDAFGGFIQQQIEQGTELGKTYEIIFSDIKSESKSTGVVMASSTKNAMSSMVQSANMYGIVYQTMMNDNLTATQKFGTIMLQTLGQVMMGMITAMVSETIATNAANGAKAIGKAFADHNFWIAMGIAAAASSAIAAATALATTKLNKGKSEIAQATNVSAGRLTTGMLTYATGRYLDDEELKKGRITAGMMTMSDGYQPGQSYSVDGADGNSYSAKYEGAIKGTGIRKGTHFGIFSEVKPEMVIDGDTTALMHSKYPMLENAILQLHRTGSLNMGEMLGLNYAGISKTIDTLYGSGRLSFPGGMRMPTFAAGRYLTPSSIPIDVDGGMETGGAFAGAVDMQADIESRDRLAAAIEALVQNGVSAHMSSREASKSLAKQQRFEKRNGIKNGLYGAR